jgi:outer membrane protein assembly factor BamD (BamD/ComL family)
MRLVVPLLTGLLLLAFAVGCASGPGNVSDTITPAELVQRAQEASDKSHYKDAKAYYELILERFPSNIDMVCTAEYEIAFIHYKQKQYDTATAQFNSLLARYDEPDGELLPPQFRRLADIVLKQIAEKTKQSRFSRKSAATGEG